MRDGASFLAGMVQSMLTNIAVKMRVRVLLLVTFGCMHLEVLVCMCTQLCA